MYAKHLEKQEKLKGLKHTAKQFCVTALANSKLEVKCGFLFAIIY